MAHNLMAEKYTVDVQFVSYHLDAIRGKLKRMQDLFMIFYNLCVL